MKINELSENDFFEDPHASLNRLYPNAYEAAWSATERWNFTDELPRNIILFSSTDSDSEEKVFGFQVSIKKVPQSYCFGLEKRKSPQGHYMISDIHKTILDCLTYPDYVGGQRQAQEAFYNYMDTPEADFSKLVSYAQQVGDKKMVSYLLKLKKDKAAL